MEKILDGIVVIELVRDIPGSYCGKMLADLGATVIKVEPKEGDETRRKKPFVQINGHTVSAAYLFYNVNKYGCFIDLKNNDDRKMLEKLMTKSHVVITDGTFVSDDNLSNYYKELSSKNSRLIMTVVKPFGLNQTLRNWEGTDLTAAALSGLVSIIGYPDREPLNLPYEQVSCQAGMNAATATLVALIEQHLNGKGMLIDISTAEVMHAYVGIMDLLYSFYGYHAERSGNRSTRSGGRYPYTILPCKDGFMCLITRTGHEWKRFVELMGHPEWTRNPRYQDLQKMGQEYPDEVDELVKDWLKGKEKQELFSLCRKHNIPFAPVQTIDEVMEDDQLRFRGFFVEIDDGDKRLFLPGVPYRFEGMKEYCIRKMAPYLGNDKESILRWLDGKGELVS